MRDSSVAAGLAGRLVNDSDDTVDDDDEHDDRDLVGDVEALVVVSKAEVTAGGDSSVPIQAREPAISERNMQRKENQEALTCCFSLWAAFLLLALYNQSTNQI